MTPESLPALLNEAPEKIEFDQIMALIAEHFDYRPSRFVNGDGEKQVINEAGSNEGSCKIFALGQLLQLNKAQTLACFGRYYREDVLQHPDADDHANIRTFMRDGWEGIEFEKIALTRKS